MSNNYDQDMDKESELTCLLTGCLTTYVESARSANYRHVDSRPFTSLLNTMDSTVQGWLLQAVEEETLTSPSRKDERVIQSLVRKSSDPSLVFDPSCRLGHTQHMHMRSLLNRFHAYDQLTLKGRHRGSTRYFRVTLHEH